MAGIILQFILIACVTFELFHSVRRFQLFFLFFLCLAISGVCHFRSSFMVFLAFCSPFSIIDTACVTYKLFSRRVSPSRCFQGVCRLQVVFTTCVAFQLTFSDVCSFHSSFMVSFVFCSSFSIHSVCRLQVVFTACTTFKLFSWRVSPSDWRHF